MSAALCQTLLELGDAVSRNLSLSYACDISYGEETITESCLLELWRRHSPIVNIQTFCKKEEAKNGADWEWHLIGKVYTLRMRVQAKRLAKNAKSFRSLFTYKAKGASHPQLKMLISDAKAQKLLPVLCFYSAEASRTKWKSSKAHNNMQPGCLVGEAEAIMASGNSTLAALETKCVPWHWLVSSHSTTNYGVPLIDLLNKGASDLKPGELPNYFVTSSPPLRSSDDTSSDYASYVGLAREFGVMGRISIDLRNEG